MYSPSQESRAEITVATLVTAFATWLLCFTEPSILQSIDHLFFHQPNFHFLLTSLKQSELPLWNPYIGLGRPFLGDLQNAVFYPPAYLLLLGEATGVFLLLWSHSLLGVWGMRRLAARLGSGGAAGWVAGPAFLLSGVLTSHLFVGHLLYFAAACYVPWIFLHTLQLDEGWERTAAARHALLMGLQLLCGHPQVFWLTTVGQGVFLLGRNFLPPWPPSAKTALLSLARLAVVTVWGLALAAVVLLPFFELVQFGNRGATTDTFINYGRLEWSHLRSLVLPTAVVSRHAQEYNWFLGPGLMMIGLLGLGRWRDRNARGLLLLASFAVLLALGDQTPCFHLFKAALPGFTSFRLPARAGLLVTFSMVLSAACAWPLLRGRLATEPRIRLAGAALAALVLGPLFWNATQAKREYSHAGYFSAPPEFPAQNALLAALPQPAMPNQPPPRVGFPWRALPANHGMIHRYADCDAYTSLFLQRPWDCLHILARVPPPDLARTALSVNIHSATPFPFPGTAQQFGYDAKNRIVLTNASVEPRAWFAAAVTGPLTYAEILVRLQQGHDQHGSPLVEDELPTKIPASPAPPQPVGFRKFSANELQLEVAAPSDGLLVLAEAWHPGWKAEAGGTVIEAIPANGWMRAFPLPAGHHHVRVFYEQDFLWPGLVISLLALAAIGKCARTTGQPPPAAGG